MNKHIAPSGTNRHKSVPVVSTCFLHATQENPYLSAVPIMLDLENLKKQQRKGKNSGERVETAGTDLCLFVSKGAIYNIGLNRHFGSLRNASHLGSPLPGVTI